MKKYLYTAKFQSFAKATQLQKKSNVAMAALSNLGQVFQKEELRKRIEQNPDLLFGPLI